MSTLKSNSATLHFLKKTLILSLIIVVFSCGNEKLLQLPEINHSEITEILDVSAGYLFYDEIKIDSVELNRKNLISTTNWLINVDKRLTLKQAIPHIKYLQEKKANSSHKKKGVENYFTCHDTSINNLGFVPFTDVVYYNDGRGYDTELNSYYAHLVVLNQNEIRIVTSDNKVFETDKASLPKAINDSLGLKKCLIYLEFDYHLTFQEYITIKSIISKLDMENIEISNHEFICN